MSICNRTPQEYKLIPCCTTGVHLWWINWLNEFLNRLDMGHNIPDSIAYTQPAFFLRQMSWNFGDEWANKIYDQYIFGLKFVGDYTRNGKPLKYQDLKQFYKSPILLKRER